jgi:hypothetical protein
MFGRTNVLKDPSAPIFRVKVLPCKFIYQTTRCHTPESLSWMRFLRKLYKCLPECMMSRRRIPAFKMEATGSSKTTVNIYQTTRCHILEDGNLHNHRPDATILQFLTPKILMSCHTHSSHLNLGLPTFQVSSSLVLNTFLIILFSLARIWCPTHTLLHRRCFNSGPHLWPRTWPVME